MTRIKKKNRCVNGSQWGDEGKGKIVDLLSVYADVVVRFHGGHNAGHTVVIDDKPFITHIIPTGIFTGKVCVIGNGVVLDPDQFDKEIKDLQLESDAIEKIWISNRSHIIITNWAKALDKYFDRVKGIDTTGRGIGPAYALKMFRAGVTAGMLLYPDVLKQYLEQLYVAIKPILEAIEPEHLNVKQVCDRLAAFGTNYKDRIIDTSYYLNEAVKDGKSILFEGAQGPMLDIDFGTYPYVTSSNCLPSSICSGAGVPVSIVDEIYAVVKAYTTRVGNGPFPTELEDEVGEGLRCIGNEFGATTGRPRRCGWLDLMVLKHTFRIFWPTKIVITKLDVLDGVETIKVCVGYELGGQIIDPPVMPAVAEVLEQVKPIYVELPGWPKGGTKGKTKWSALHPNAQKYLRWIEQQMGVPIAIISTGSKREETIFRRCFV